jgi:hypothetical protein
MFIRQVDEGYDHKDTKDMKVWLTLGSTARNTPYRDRQIHGQSLGLSGASPPDVSRPFPSNLRVLCVFAVILFQTPIKIP